MKRVSEAVNGSDRTPREAPASPPELLAAPGFLARRLYQAYLSAWSRLVDPALTGPQFAVLTAVARFGGTDQGSLAATVALDRSTMADVVRRLEERGLVMRKTDTEDGRRKLLYLTPLGTGTYNDVYERARDLDEMLWGGRTPVERQVLMAELTELAELWENIAPLS
ncbi:MarR family winged helix-turn-helix transcriptional regulator [Rhodococcus sp. IEGM 1366]|uniref:MarR family winged helix-turn-helix transcriptional regulator n=1 Tax=Rhodococcus sp. IEGM 1366 TaxID=3082223 RepID=UPI002953976F|nr:MarR family winged helix-turn-helix transcriptional regulator [Rhodococcus sp. IEGM 1366]MDV8071342.1 MarR family winged helix-turn-helix transcriptional regulator [Rhodococcus sp. IEGM 1366]